MANIFNGVLWFLVLYLISIWVAFLCAFLYIVLSVFEVCIPPLKQITEVLLKGVMFPHTCAEGVYSCKPMC